MKSVRYYDFTLTAGSTQVILAEGDNFRIQSQTGAIDVTVEGVGTLPGLLTGQGLNGVQYKRLILRDASGSNNTGTILVAPAEFVDNRTYGVNSLDTATINQLIRPQQQTGFFSLSSNVVANTPDTVVAPGSNVSGLILLNASLTINNATTPPVAGFITKASSPTGPLDGSMVAGGGLSVVLASVFAAAHYQNTPQFIAAGQGLYFISDVAGAAGSTGSNFRSCRYRLL